MPITALYAGLLAPILVYLAVRVIGRRRDARIGIGHGEDMELLRRIRVHANFAEYVPMALVLMALAEGLKVAPLLLHGLGVTLLVGRLLHAYGVSQPKENLSIRVAGMTATFAVLIVGALVCLSSSLGVSLFS
jgi:hypothetical protein